MANNTVYPYGTGGQLPSSIGLVNDYLTGGSDKALTAQAGKQLADDIQKDLFSSLFFKATINSSGVPSESDTRIISKLLSGNFSIEFKNSNYKVWAIAYYTSAGEYMSVQTVSYSGLTYERMMSPSVMYRLVLAKANGTDSVNLADYPVNRLFVGYTRDVLKKSLPLEQGSIGTSTWNRSSARVCNVVPIVGAFEIEVNSGYIIRYGVYEDSAGVLHELLAQSSTRTSASYSNTGDIKTYLTFCKTDTTADVAPTEGIIKYIYYKGDGAKFPIDAGGYMDFSVSVDTNVANVESNALTLQDAQVFESDMGRIYLPKSYTEEGTPTRLIIHCHGASQNYNNGTVFPKNASLVTVDYLLAKGYAVMDVNGLPGTHSFYATTSANPVAYRSYIKAYDWVVSHYNLYKEVFVIGISAGSLPALQLSTIGTIPVLAAVTYCGVMDFSRAWMLLGGYHPNSQGPDIKAYLADKYDFVGTQPTLGDVDPCSDDEWAYVVSNAEKISGWNPFTKGITSTMTHELYREIVSTVYGSTIPSWIDSNYTYESVQQMLLAFKIPQRGSLANYQTAIAQEQRLIDSCSIHRTVPLKIFHAENDDVAPFRYSRYYYEMCKRGGSTVEFRAFSSGKHNPMGNTISVTVDGVSISTNVLSVEVLDWLQRFETR